MSGLKLQKRMVRKVGGRVGGNRPEAFVKKEEFLLALAGSMGNKTEIARRLNISHMSVWRLLKREDWGDMVAALVEEEIQTTDLLVSKSIEANFECLTQKLDYSVKLNASKFNLAALHPSFRDSRKVTIDGGPNPIRVIQVQIPADILNQPLEAKKAALALAEEEERRAVKQIESQVSNVAEERI